MSGAERPISLWWRLWTVQGSWNRRGMQNLGWLVVLLPWLRERGWDAATRGRWLERYRGFSNTNPYFAGLVLGVVVHQESRRESGKTLADGLSRSLGTLGDGLTWGGIRPALASWAGALALLFGPAAAVVAWLAFAAWQAWLRLRCFELGIREGPGVVERFSSHRLHGAIATARRFGLMGAGILAVFVLAPVLGSFDPRMFLGLAGALAAGQVAAVRGWPPERVIWGTVALAWLATRAWWSVSSGT